VHEVLIIGIGNELRGDDSLGVHVVRELRGLAIPRTTLVEADGEGASLIELWRGHARVILIDAFSSGSTPGLIHALDVSTTSVSEDLFRVSSHAFGVAEAIEISRRLGDLPEKLFLYGIEGKRFGLGDGLSLAVRERMPEFLEEIILKIEELVHERVGEPPR
jgi:hydrogenase maturation protease